MKRNDLAQRMIDLIDSAPPETTVGQLRDQARALAESPTEPLRLGHVVCDALRANYPREEVDGVEKMRRFNLALIAFKCQPAEVEAGEDVALIKSLIARSWGVEIVGCAFANIDPPIKAGSAVN